MRLRPFRLRPGSDLRQAIEALAGQFPETSCFLVAGIGSLTRAHLRMASQIADQVVAGPLEIISVSGTVSEDGAHLHMSVANALGQVLGGHVCFGCEVRTTAELLLAEVHGFKLTREVDPATGFKELKVQEVDGRNAA